MLDTTEGTAVKVGSAIASQCSHGCEVQRFAWPRATPEIVYSATDAPFNGPVGTWVARRQPDGSFDRPVLAYPSRMLPLWTARAGVVDLVGQVDHDWAGHGGGSYAIPYGGPRARLRPRISFAAATSSGSTLTVNAWCRTTCRVSGSLRAVQSSQAYPVTAFAGNDSPPLGTLAALQPVELRATLPPAAAQLRLTLTIRDAYGHRTRQILTLGRGAQDDSAKLAWRVTV